MLSKALSPWSVALALCLALPLIALGACNKGPSARPPQEAEPPPPPPGEAVPEPVIPEPPAAESYVAVVTTTTVVRKIASDNRYLPETAGEKKKSNWVATLYRGESVEVSGQSGAFSAIKTSGDEAGFIKSTSLLRADEAKVATVLEDAKTFQRPDILTMNANKTINAGAFLFVVNTKAEFSEVNYAATYTRWVRTDALVFDDKEIGAAKLLDQIRYQEGRKETDKVKQLKELGRNTYGETRLGALFNDDDAKAAEAGDAADAADKNATDKPADAKATGENPAEGKVVAPAKDPKAVIDDKTRSQPATTETPPTRARPASAPASGGRTR